VGKKLFLYDFDGTITKKDSLFLFLKYSSNTSSFVGKFLVFSPLFFLAKLGLFSKSKIKERFVAAFLKGKTKSQLDIMAEGFLENLIETRGFREKALQSIEKHKKEGTVYIVSASLDIWLGPIAAYLDVKLICTQAHYQKGRLMGKFLGPNCNGEQKPIRVRAEIDLDAYNEIHYFGDSKGDLPMKSVVHQFYYKMFH